MDGQIHTSPSLCLETHDHCSICSSDGWQKTYWLVFQAALLACLKEQWSARDIPAGLRPHGEPKAWLAELLTENQSIETNRQYRLIGTALHGLKLPQTYSYQLGNAGRDGRALKLSIVLKGPWGTPRKVGNWLPKCQHCVTMAAGKNCVAWGRSWGGMQNPAFNPWITPLYIHMHGRFGVDCTSF